ncbi:MAG: hypothetical protein R2857_02770 [Vampirovibrionales bacterium]
MLITGQMRPGDTIPDGVWSHRMGLYGQVAAARLRQARQLQLVNETTAESIRFAPEDCLTPATAVDEDSGPDGLPQAYSDNLFGFAQVTINALTQALGGQSRNYLTKTEFPALLDIPSSQAEFVSAKLAAFDRMGLAPADTDALQGALAGVYTQMRTLADQLFDVLDQPISAADAPKNGAADSAVDGKLFPGELAQWIRFQDAVGEVADTFEPGWRYRVGLSGQTGEAAAWEETVQDDAERALHQTVATDGMISQREQDLTSALIYQLAEADAAVPRKLKADLQQLFSPITRQVLPQRYTQRVKTFGRPSAV